jgi:serine/threonine-protein kinase
MSLAGPRQTLLSRTTFDLGRRAALDDERWDESLRWLAHGAYVVQGIDEPLEVFEVGVASFAPLVAPADSEKARRAVTVSDELVLGWRPATGQPIPRRLNWTLAERLGEGSFGEVWLARHKSGDARVFKFCFEAAKLRGLKREVTLFRVLRDALGQRSDIARILDWSFDEAPYFLEVEHTAGGSLADWAERRGGAVTVPAATRLELAAQVAVALGAAHSVGILHKDVKPENVLVFEGVEGEPHVRLADFGIGRLTDDSLLMGRAFTIQGMTEATVGGSEGGTRIYMAPELLEGKPASIQADLYALGVLLYQLATGDLSRALAPGWERDVEDELVAADIAALVDREPSRRPASALVVAEGLRGLGERRAALEAQRRSAAATQRAREAEERARRRRKMFSVAGTVAALGGVGVGVRAGRAVRARRDAEKALALAEHRRGQAENLIGFMLGDLPEKLAPQGSLEVLADVSDKAMEYFADLAVEDVTSDTLAQRAEALRQIGDVRLQQHDLEAAQVAFEQSLVQMEQLVRQEPDRGELRAGLADTHFWLGYVLWQRGDVEAALAAYEEHRRAYEALVEEDPGQEDWTLELAYGHMNVGDARLALGRLDEAREHHERALNLVEELANTHPERTDLRFETAEGHLRVGRIKVQLGDVEGALLHFGADLRILRGLLAENSLNTAWQRSLAVTYGHVGSAREGRAEPRQALNSFLRAEAIFADLSALDVTNAEWRVNLLANRSNVARVLASLGRTDEALQRLEDNRILARDAVNEDPSSSVLKRALVTAHRGLAEVRLQRGERDQALEDAFAAVEIARRLAEVQNSAQHRLWLSNALSVLAAVHAARGEENAARDAREQAVSSIEETVRESFDPKILQRQIEALVDLERLDEARAVVERLVQHAAPSVLFSSYLREHGIAPQNATG